MKSHRRSATTCINNSNTLEKICENGNIHNDPNYNIGKEMLGRMRKAQTLDGSHSISNFTRFNSVENVDNGNDKFEKRKSITSAQRTPREYEYGDKFIAIKSIVNKSSDALDLQVGDTIEFIGYSEDKKLLGKITKDFIDSIGSFSIDTAQYIDLGITNTRSTVNNANRFESVNEYSPTDKTPIVHRRSETSIIKKLNLAQFVNTFVKRGHLTKCQSHLSGNINNLRRISQNICKTSDTSEFVKSDDSKRNQPTTSSQNEKYRTSSASVDQTQSITEDSTTTPQTADKSSDKIYVTYYIERRTTFERITLHLNETSFLKISSTYS